MQTNWNIEFLNHNAQRSYPLLDGVSKKDTTNSYTIPDDFIVDFDLSVHEDDDIDPGLFHIQSLSIFTLGIVLTLGYNGTAIASISISKSGHTLNKTYWFSGEGTFSDSRGKITIGKLDGINNGAAGDWTFSLAATRILPTLIKPSLRGVQSIVLVNNQEQSEELTGTIELVAGTNIRFDIDTETNAVTINAIDGEGFNTGCDCNGAIGQPIRFINGVSADSAGNFYINNSECISIEAASRPNSITIHDTCSQPCCGCTELEIITDALRQLQNQHITIQDFLNRLDTNLRAMETNLVASKTGNITCS